MNPNHPLSPSPHHPITPSPHHPISSSPLSTLSSLFPPYLLFLVFSPLLIGYCIDSDLSDSRNILINLVWMLVFTLPLAFTGKRFIYTTAVIIYFVVGLIEITHWLILKGPLTLTSLLVISNTNYQEAKEFMSLKAGLGLLLLFPYLFLFIWTLKHPPQHSGRKLNLYVVGIVVVISLLFIVENVVHGRLIRKGVPEVAKVGFSFIENIHLYQQAMLQTEARNIHAKSTLSADSQSFVLILGESCSRRHMSLYRPYRETNPRLKKRNDLIVYQDVISPYCNTLNAVLSILSEQNLDNKKVFDQCIDIIDVMHSAGFKTYWISNQSPIGVWDNLVTVFANKSDYCKFTNTSSNSSFEATYTSSYDEKLLFPLFQVLQEKAKKKFIVIHLMGSHSSYGKRYPSTFSVFQGETRKERTIAEYDNSVLYNDFIVDSLLTIIKSNVYANRTLASVVYLSDHSENVYDENDNCGHDFAGQIPASIVEIPFMVWLSDEYKNRFPEKVKTIEENAQKPFLSDDLFHSIIDLNSIETPVYESVRSVFNANYNSSRLRVLENGIEYRKK